MAHDYSFPQELLTLPIADRISYFQQYTMAHPKLLIAAEKLKNAIDDPGFFSLIFLFGPTGVGKTTLLRRIRQRLLASFHKEMELDKGFIPIANIEVATPEFSNFDWKDFYLRALGVLQDPCIQLPSYGRITNLKLKTSLEAALKHRRLKVFCLDEAQNLSKVASGRKLRDQTDCIKSLANLTQVKFVLAGTYDLLILRNLSAQLCRRSLDIHFERYKVENEEDLKAFRGVVQTFQRHLPFEEEPDLLKYWDFCYERSFGCVGILKDWLSQALATALLDGAKTLTLSHLKSSAYSHEQCMIIFNETRLGEKQLEFTPDSSALRIALGLESHHGSATHSTSQTTNTTNTKSRRSTTGNTKPQRRPVGGGENVG